MIHLNIVVEGPTEETFVRDVLAPYWGSIGIFAVARSVETAREKGRIFRGGGRNYIKARQDILTWLKQQKNSWCTTMLDLYGIYNNFPTYSPFNASLSPYERVNKLEEAFAEDIANSRFIPYLQLHEFEALLFSDIEQMYVYYFDKDRQIKRLMEMAARYDSPELINESEANAPSKRIIKEIPEYKSGKVIVGPKVARAIGLERIRMKCPHFNEWMCRIESLIET